MSDHSAILRKHHAALLHSPSAQLLNSGGLLPEYDAFTLAADVLDAIPDKDDPLAWVQSIEKNLNDRFDLMLARKQDRNEQLQAELDALLDAIPGDDKRLVAEWAVKIAAELMDEWEEGSTHADTYYIVEHWWRACPPSVRAALRCARLAR